MELVVFSGSANPKLASEIAGFLGIKLGQIEIKRFADSEIYVRFLENIRGKDVFLVQGTNNPANENLAELLDYCKACFKHYYKGRRRQGNNA